MADMETVITHLKIIYTWAEFARERDLNFFTKKHFEDIAQWAYDTIELLQDIGGFGEELNNAMELIHKKNERIKKLEEQIETLTKWRANAGAFD